MATNSPPTILVLFGCTGDLARLKILPALRELSINGRLPHDFQLLAVGRREMTTAEYVDYLANIEVHPFKHDLDMLKLKYLHLDFASEDGFKPLRKILEATDGARVLFYMSVGPDVLELSIDQFSQPEFRNAVKHNNSAVIVEKPFGENLNDARELNRKLNSIFGVRNIFRNDHYLNKDAIQNIVPIRKNDPEMQKLLTREELAEIQIIVAEQVDLGTRASYFDCRGMIVDWVQSHMLQMLAVLCADLDTDNFGVSKAEFIDSLRLQPHSVIRAQYDGYADMPAVDDACQTETFLAMQFSSLMSKWKDVTFSLIAGKALAEKEVVINLRLKHPHPKLGDVVALQVNSSGDEYQDTLMQAIHDEWEKFVSQQEVEAQWRITETARTALKETPLEHYPKGISYKHFCTDTWCVRL